MAYLSSRASGASIGGPRTPVPPLAENGDQRGLAPATLFRRKTLKHPGDITVKRLRILVCVRRQILRSQTSPKQILGIAIEYVDHQVGHWLVGRGGCGLAKSAWIS